MVNDPGDGDLDILVIFEGDKESDLSPFCVSFKIRVPKISL